MDKRRGPMTKKGQSQAKFLPKIPSRRPVAILAVNRGGGANTQLKVPRIAPDRPSQRQKYGLNGRRLAKSAPAPTEPKPVPKPAPVQRKPLYDRLLAILSKDRTSDVQTMNAELQLVALHDDPLEMTQMSKEQLDELARSSLDAETFQASLLGASIVEQMTENQSQSATPLLSDAFLRYLFLKFKEQKNWQRLVGAEGDYLLVSSLEADLFLQAYGMLVDNAYVVWTVRTKDNIVLDGEEGTDHDLHDAWIELWSTFFHVVDRYTATLATRIGPEAFYARDISEDTRIRFLDDLLHFVTQLRDEGESALRDRLSHCYDIYAPKLDAVISACVKADYDLSSGSADGTSEAHFDEILSSLAARCLQCGPKLLGHSEDGGIDPKEGVSPENVNWRTDGVILRGLLNAFESVKEYQQHPMDPVVRQNIADMFDKVLFQVDHSCIGQSVCACYSRCPDPALVEATELFICETVANRFPTDFAPHIDDFVAHYRGVPSDRWMRALLTVYPSAKREVTKYFSLFADMENDNQLNESFQDWRPIALSLMVKVSFDNAKLFDSKLIKSVEAIFFSKKSVLSSRALLVLRNVAANHPRAMLGCGRHYYAAATELPGLEIAPLRTVNEILRNIGLYNEEEAERVVALMEAQVRHSQDKSFIEDVLRQWHYIAIVFHEPVEARRALIDEYRQDPMLCKAAYEVFALSTGQQNKATACSLM